MDARTKDYPFNLRYVQGVRNTFKPESAGEFLRVLILSIKRDIEAADRRAEAGYFKQEEEREKIIDRSI